MVKIECAAIITGRSLIMSHSIGLEVFACMMEMLLNKSSMSYVSKACDIISKRALGSRHCCKHTGDGGKQMVQQLINFCCCLTDPKSFICDDSDQALYQNHSHSGDNLLTTLIYLS